MLRVRSFSSVIHQTVLQRTFSRLANLAFFTMLQSRFPSCMVMTGETAIPIVYAKAFMARVGAPPTNEKDVIGTNFLAIVRLRASTTSFIR